ncbi:hypothetical protein TNCT_435231 [Trichonephila clavata]|uniref:Uncharacterized protein n=1 Tax=Trichonephila clavata TaxID=2740835 RepID=A0A8X6F2K8_TRICU|nr:hypothetical protein TNCT_435231 [Trichonephila clavata]
MNRWSDEFDRKSVKQSIVVSRSPAYRVSILLWEGVGTHHWCYQRLETGERYRKRGRLSPQSWMGGCDKINKANLCHFLNVALEVFLKALMGRKKCSQE